jgi:alkanesulfonate monooxygenase SsuD/methylene tetrahydromethanopterin reductase-like flavin-dependent oxidoreductase (luciferase family)
MIEGQEDVSWDDWRALAGACEEHGVETLFRSDHYLSVEGRRERGSLDAWATLAALAATTSTVRLGTLVSPATFRHPSELAKVAATVDHISGGRVEVGLGTGWSEPEHAAYGFPFPPLGKRMSLLGEQLELVSREWADGAFSFEGRHYRVRDLDARPKPVQRPLAARFADEYNTVFETVERCATIRRDLAAACEREGREVLPLSLMTGWLVGDDRSELVDRAARLADWSGYDGTAESFLEGRPQSWIVGTLDEARQRLDELAAAGVERVMLQHLLHRDLGAVAQMGRLASP